MERLILIVCISLLHIAGFSQSLNTAQHKRLSNSDLQGLLSLINKTKSDSALTSGCYCILRTSTSSDRIQKQLKAFLNSKGFIYDKDKSGFSESSNSIKGVLIKADKKEDCIEIYLGTI